jgi:hypothetical protein
MNLSFLTVLWKARTLKISKPGHWVTAEGLSELYNQTYSIALVNKLMQEEAEHQVDPKSLLKKTIIDPLRLEKMLHRINMNPRRMSRILQKFVQEGRYIFDPEKGYCFMTKTPNKR